MPIIDRTQQHPQVAMPGDPNLDCDITGTVLTSVVTLDATREIECRLVGGDARWIDQHGDLVDNLDAVELCLSMRCPDYPDDLWRYVVDQLTAWRDAGTELWFGAVPGKLSTLIEDPDHYVLIPVQPDPAGRGAPT